MMTASAVAIRVLRAVVILPAPAMMTTMIAAVATATAAARVKAVAGTEIPKAIRKPLSAAGKDAHRRAAAGVIAPVHAMTTTVITGAAVRAQTAGAPARAAAGMAIPKAIPKQRSAAGKVVPRRAAVRPRAHAMTMTTAAVVI